MTIAEALPHCFPLPPWVVVGNQQWAISCSSMRTGPTGTIRLQILMSGPYERFRHVRISLGTQSLLAGDYDASMAANAIARWLPHSDASDVLELTEADLIPRASFGNPAHYQI